MAFLRPNFVHDAAPFVRSDGLILRPPAPSDYVAWATLRAASRAHLVPFEPQWAHDELTRAAYRQRLRRYQACITEANSLGVPPRDWPDPAKCWPNSSRGKKTLPPAAIDKCGSGAYVAERRHVQRRISFFAD